MRLTAGRRRHADAALAVVVDHALVVVPENVPKGQNNTDEM